MVACMPPNHEFREWTARRRGLHHSRASSRPLALQTVSGHCWAQRGHLSPSRRALICSTRGRQRPDALLLALLREEIRYCVPQSLRDVDTRRRHPAVRNDGVVFFLPFHDIRWCHEWREKSNGRMEVGRSQDVKQPGCQALPSACQVPPWPSKVVEYHPYMYISI